MAEIMPEYESSDEEKPKENLNKKDQGANLTGWNELFLKDELKRAIRECGFEHPSEVQVEAIPLALQGQDILCQAKSGMGKTAVFVISILNQIVPLTEGEGYDTHQAIITCHTRELAHQIYKDFKRLGNWVLTQVATSRSPNWDMDVILAVCLWKKTRLISRTLTSVLTLSLLLLEDYTIYLTESW